MSESLTRRSSSPEERRSPRPEQDNAEKGQPTAVARGLPPGKILKPRACRSYARRHLAAAWPVVVTNLLDKAVAGSVPHTTLAAKLAGFDLRPEPQQKRERREKSFARQLLDEIDELEKKNIEEFGPL